MFLCSSGLEVLVPKGVILPPGETTMNPLNWKLRLPSGHFGLLKTLNQQAKKRVTVLARVIDPDYKGETGLILHNGADVTFPDTALLFCLTLNALD
uniref:dUTPase-like domain-containing protein n=1 Tax=Equus caballus TaxID=9796 RepID=A0A9L0TEU7_HORSE